MSVANVQCSFHDPSRCSLNNHAGHLYFAIVFNDSGIHSHHSAGMTDADYILAGRRCAEDFLQKGSFQKSSNRDRAGGCQRACFVALENGDHACAHIHLFRFYFSFLDILIAGRLCEKSDFWQQVVPRIFSRRSHTSLLELISSGISVPFIPMSSARTRTIGLETSRIVASIRPCPGMSSTSSVLHVGRSFPVLEPAGLRKSTLSSAAVLR